MSIHHSKKAAAFFHSNTNPVKILLFRCSIPYYRYPAASPGVWFGDILCQKIAPPRQVDWRRQTPGWWRSPKFRKWASIRKWIWIPKITRSLKNPIFIRSSRKNFEKLCWRPCIRYVEFSTFEFFNSPWEHWRFCT